MQQARKNQQYERAGILRDCLKALSHIQSKQMVHIPNQTDVDVIAVAMPAGQISGQVFVYRNGSHYGNFAQVVALPDDVTSAEFLQDFMLQHYQDHEPPQTIYISEEIADHALVDEALRQMRKGAVTIEQLQRGNKTKLVAMTLQNAKETLDPHLTKKATTKQLLSGLQELLDLEGPPLCIEIYDNSHLGGTHALGVMVVATPYKAIAVSTSGIKRSTRVMIMA